MHWNWTFAKCGWFEDCRLLEDKEDIIDYFSEQGIKLVESSEWNESQSMDNSFVLYFPSAGKHESHAYLTQDELGREMEEIRDPFNYMYHPKLVSELDLSESDHQDTINISVAEYNALQRLADNDRRIWRV